MPRPTRPSTEKADLEKVAAEIVEGKPVKRRLCVRVHPDTLAEVTVSAAVSRKKVERFVIDALIAAGVKVHPTDAKAPE